jgi:hypothetical protein
MLMGVDLRPVSGRNCGSDKSRTDVLEFDNVDEIVDDFI